MARRGIPKPFAILVAMLLAFTFVPFGALSATAADNVTFIPGAGEACNGVKSTPGSENTTKNLTGGTLQPGGTVEFTISYPVSPLDEDDVFVLTDCFVREDTGAELDKFEIRFVPNDQDFSFNYVLDIPADVPLGTEVCNYIKTTEGPSASPASNRKGGVCFTVGGTLRIEKRATGDDGSGNLLEGAKFNVACDPSADFPEVVISGLEDARPSGTPVTGNPAEGYANDGYIAINAPEGTVCTVTELEAPPGYVLPDDVTNEYTVPRTGSEAATQVIYNSAPTPTSIVTQATGPVTIGSPISDTATVSPSNATGMVTFRLYGPNNATCAGDPIFTSADRPVVNGQATSADFTPTAVGTYRWIANFVSSDTDVFLNSTGGCNDANESSVVNKKQPTIVTDSTDSATLPNASISDTATVSNLTADASGTVTFRLYAPGDTNCTGTVLFTSEKALGTVASGAASVTSDAFAATQVGTYRWVASYSGDAKNAVVSGACNDPNESTVVNPAVPTIVTDAEDVATLPDAVIGDFATLSGVTQDAGGTISFRAYYDTTPETPTCDDSTLVFTSSALAVSGPGRYPTSGQVTTTVAKAGTYFWIATYSGDAKNLGVEGTCGDSTETSNVDKAPNTIETTATGGQLPATTSISDGATLKGLTADAGGSVTFTVYGPYAANSSPTCSGTPFAMRTVPVSGVGSDHEITVSSGPVPITVAGKYYWVASYTGDSNNSGATGACGAAGETSTVAPANPTLVTTATNGTLPPGTVTDSANLTGVTANAGGSITFRLYGPSATPNCTGNAVFTSSAVAVNGPGNYGPVTATVTAGGSYYWVARYSGDANNNAVEGACGAASETSTVRVLTGALNVTKAVSPVAGGGTVIEFGDTLTYTLTVSATGELTQNNVVVKDFIPGYDPARPTSGKTTYVNGSASCVGFTCTATYSSANHQLTWALGDMAPGTSRQVTFKVTIDPVQGDPGETVAVDILNAGSVQSTQTPVKPSNQVKTTVTEVFPIKNVKPPKVLPHTGAGIQPGPVAAGAMTLLALGLLLMVAGRRRSGGAHRA